MAIRLVKMAINSRLWLVKGEVGTSLNPRIACKMYRLYASDSFPFYLPNDDSLLAKRQIGSNGDVYTCHY